jgi:pimeloyl-ACP methyl ester carboxylesterase
MDGTGTLFEPFIKLLPTGFDARVVSYPEDTYLTYQELAERAASFIPLDEPYLIVAESYSGPVAILLAARRLGQLRAVVLVASFVSPPRGRFGSCASRFVPVAFFRVAAPAWILRRLLLDRAASPEVVASVRKAVAGVKPDVLSRRLRDALSADFAPLLADCAARIVCLAPDADRLLGEGSSIPGTETIRVAGPHLLLQCAPATSLTTLRKLRLFDQN